MIWLKSIIVLLCSQGIHAVEDPMGDNVRALVQWVKDAPTGFVHENIEIRRYKPEDLSCPFGAFVTTFIPANTTLFVIPREYLITAEGYEDQCYTVKHLVREMRLGNQSKYAPYVNYLLDQPTGQLPNGWSEEGQELLEKILVDRHEDAQFLPPEGPFGYTFEEECKDPYSDDLTEDAYLIVLQRSWDDVLIPVYDMLSHRNGKWLNTECDSIHYNTNDVTVRASRDIQPGEELYTSYNFCVDCSSRDSDYGTPEILRDYGFVEQYPQRWIFHQYDNLGFELDEVEHTNEAGEVNKVMQVTWLFDEPPDDGIEFLEGELLRLEDVYRAEFQEELNVPANEELLCRQFLDALMNAIAHAIESANDLDHQCTDMTNNASGSCEVLLEGDESRRPRYDALQEERDHLDYTSYLCKQGRTMEFPKYKVLEVTKSLYQKIAFFHNPENKDTCFELDTVVQICGSYRAHYHEMVVHYTARFFDTVKRVLFVGGGDSMLLHEIIKYPSLELVVGLELDQQVTRGSFKHFGTQPHWDNEKVQWWYGDAAKSLLMLPSDYFGSFDMVLVDLSETVMSMTVTDGLDIFGALALLLKPDGIIVKNELYLEKFSEIFDYTVQVHFRDVPVICTQALVFGSYANDMLYKHPINHDTGPNLFVTPYDDNQLQFESWHDYRRRKRASQQKTCKNPDDVEEVITEQKRSPGILMVLETENAATLFESAETFQSALLSSLQAVGVKVVDAFSQSTESAGGAVVVLLEEGYVVARRWPHHSYCAFDIHMWANFDAHESIKKAAIQLTGSTGEHSSSSYRIVAGGIFGVQSWKQDEKSRGPRLTRDCYSKTDVARKTPEDSQVSKIVLKRALELIKDADYSALVFCGDKSSVCNSLEVFKEAAKGTVVPVWTCQGIDLKNEYALSAKLACEKQVLSTITEAAKAKVFRVVVLDDTVSYEFGQIIHRVFKSRFTRKEILANDVLVVANSLDVTEEWRRAFLDRFRRDFIVLEPVFRAEVLFNNSDSSMEMGVLSSGDDRFFENLLAVCQSIEKETNLEADVRNVQGGLFKYMPKFKPSQFFLPKDYDQSAPLKQWNSQQPVGRQTVIQLEVEPIIDKVITEKTVIVNGKEEVKKIVEKVPRTDDPFVVTRTLVKEAVRNVVRSMDDKAVAQAEVYEINIGEGSINVLLWYGGNAIVLWDGRSHVDINIFTQGEDMDVTEQFSTLFIEAIPRLATRLRDEQPRGFGRVVNFLKDVDPRVTPHWA
ncbi:hypothetical protein FisN_1Lh211 [Fistulifera solaris]|uniref:SET domain-containing protein n=1 Tax=Fistulifera solaris TaxID=1519565 RepID=A0A1Z5K4G4_FISSO|nr:hypothetical protein FisN_1Lh211 [Fistulifera solaris]|eukprot:GAX21114.1 hypothetical protein FisN_1Lh211 [Fistulifera solaris]